MTRVLIRFTLKPKRNFAAKKQNSRNEKQEDSGFYTEIVFHKGIKG